MTLTDEYPLPWSVDAVDDRPYGEFSIHAANGDVVLSCEPYSGDGAQVYLSVQQARDLCELVNRGIV